MRNRSTCLTTPNPSEPHLNRCMGHFRIPSAESSLRPFLHSLVRTKRMGLRFGILWLNQAFRPSPVSVWWGEAIQDLSYRLRSKSTRCHALGRTCPGIFKTLAYQIHLYLYLRKPGTIMGFSSTTGELRAVQSKLPHKNSDNKEIVTDALKIPRLGRLDERSSAEGCCR